MYDELVKRLREPCQYENCILCQQAADAIEELVKESERWQAEAKDWYLAYMGLLPTCWIPVTERLPSRDDAVLCVGDNGISIADFVCGGKWCALPMFYVDGEQETNVTHWMPLPEPPKEATDGPA